MTMDNNEKLYTKEEVEKIYDFMIKELLKDGRKVNNEYAKNGGIKAATRKALICIYSPIRNIFTRKSYMTVSWMIHEKDCYDKMVEWANNCEVKKEIRF